MFSIGVSLTFGGSRSGPKRLSDSPLNPCLRLDGTSVHFAGSDNAFPSEAAPYILFPTGTFPENTRVAIDDLASVVFGNKITAAICRDHGPVKKIGEGSIPVHEGLCPSTRPLRRNCRRPMSYPQGEFRFVSAIFCVVRFGLGRRTDSGKIGTQSPIAGLRAVQ